MSDRSKLLTALAAAFEQQGWEYDLSTAVHIADQVAEGQTSAKALAKSVSSDQRRRLGAATDGLEQAIEEALRTTPMPRTSTSESMRVLFVAAGPSDEDRLRLGAEHRDIVARIRASSTRDQIVVHATLAARPTDLLDAINQFNPTVLHLAGHGDTTGIALEDEYGESVDVSTESLRRLVATAGEQLRLVVLNSCESSAQAKPIAEVIPAAIGMADSVRDDAARAFSAQLYSSLAEGLPLQRAFDQGCLQVTLAGLKGSDLPRLFVRPGQDASRMVFVS